MGYYDAKNSANNCAANQLLIDGGIVFSKV